MSEMSLRAALGSDTLLLVVVLFVGIVGSGVARWGLGQVGLTTLGDLIYVLGYAGMVFTVWYGWIRPLDITGPD
ncbi:hypothetical protein EGH24_08550 [Halonotius terrestris]|uniref:Uncharacterized protein n=1 Tax=Halonotius terrestris TaxID=2487750 RepID=A0A8J8TBP7_9EURY|nr:hypothetical protein [Halonotius terrestris]TQQ81172.1 hypothetical protein EGH24_08550 [Halonotius terrestris]